MKGLTFVCSVCVIVFCSASTSAADESKQEATRLVVDLRDGSHIIGNAALSALPIHSQVSGRMEVKLKTVESIELASDRELARISFKNGDVLTGIIDLRALELQTLLGKVSLPLTEMVRIRRAPFAVAAAVARGSALKFDGNDKVYIADAPMFELQDLTLQALIKIQAAGPVGSPSRVILFRGDIRMDNDPYYLALTDEGLLYTGIDQESGEKFYAEAERKAPLDEWLQVTGTYDSKEKMLRLYINGELGAETATTGNPLKVLTGPDPGLAVGNFQSRVWPNMFVGMIDEVRIWKVALTQAQIQQNMYKELSGKEPGLVAYWDFDEGKGQVARDRTAGGHDGCLGNEAWKDASDPTWVVSDAPIEYPTEDKLAKAAERMEKLKEIEAQLAKNIGPELTLVVDLIDGSTIVGRTTIGVAPIITKWAGKVKLALKSVSAIEFEEDRENVKVTLQNGDVLRGIIDLPGLKLETAFGKVVIPIEHVVGVGNASVSILTVTKGISGKAYYFDGDGYYIEVPDSKSLDISGSEITISAWIEAKRIDTRQVIVAKTAWGDNTWLVEINPTDFGNGKLNFYLYAGDTDANFGSETAITIDKWYNVACVYDGKEKRIYINGQLDATGSDSGAIHTNNQPVRIGSWGDPIGLGETRYFKGTIDEVAIHNRALSAEEIQQLHRAPGELTGEEQGLVGYWRFDEDDADFVKDKSPNHNHGTHVEGLAPSWGPFTITKQKYSETENLDEVIRNELGGHYRLADWQDILEQKHRIRDFMEHLGWQKGVDLLVSKGGNRFWGDSSRHFYISRHDHNRPPSYLAHDNTDNHLISLGSWYGIKMRVLCIREDADSPGHTPPKPPGTAGPPSFRWGGPEFDSTREVILPPGELYRVDP